MKMSIGAVALVALANLSGLPLHAVFRLFIPALGVLTTAQVYLFATRATKSPSIGLGAAIAYGFWAWFGSIDSYRWGGLPNEMGMLLLMWALSVLLGDGRGRRPRWSPRIPFRTLDPGR